METVIYMTSGVEARHARLLLDTRLTIMIYQLMVALFFVSSRRRHTRLQGDWGSDVCSSDLGVRILPEQVRRRHDHPRRAVPALQRVLFVEGTLERMQAAVRQALDRGDVGAVRQIGRASCRERV